ncbi:hypothetical protein MKX01_002619 [Papaver californicum]|nr:hypothetical protein MKX01_002619 [Papaver californicum]
MCYRVDRGCEKERRRMEMLSWRISCCIKGGKLLRYSGHAWQWTFYTCTQILLAPRSEVFKTMLASDLCKSVPIDSISLPEFNHEELETFLEFLYCGKLIKEKFDKHFYSPALAADKYVIPHLQTYCEQHILELLDSSNALKILEISEICSNEVLKVAALKSILSHSKEIYVSPGLENLQDRSHI